VQLRRGLIEHEPKAFTAKQAGVLRHASRAPLFTVERYEPAAVHAGCVDFYWSTEWNVPAAEGCEQEILMHPCVQLVVERGESGLFGISTGRAVKQLIGRGRAFGIRIAPGAVRCLVEGAASRWTNRCASLAQVLGERGARYEAEVLAQRDDAGRVDCAERLLSDVARPADPWTCLARQIVAAIQGERELVRVAQVAQRFDLKERALQRLFQAHVGVRPKWVIMRYRLHEALERIESGAEFDLAGLATQLHYFDQAHFTRDFTELVGCSPSAYMARLQRTEQAD